MSGIIDVKNDRTSVRRNAATSFTFTRFASGTRVVWSSSSSSSAEGSSTVGVGVVVGESLSATVVVVESVEVQEVIFSFFSAAIFGGESVESVVVAAGEGTVSGVAAWAMAAASAASSPAGAARARGMAFGLIPWALLICWTTICRARSNRSALLLRKKPI